MELALPHIMIRICGPGIGPDLVAALGVYPLEISEARDTSEARRSTSRRPPIVVVVTDPPDVEAAIAQTWNEFPKTPILIIGGSRNVQDSADARRAPETVAKGWVDAIPRGQPLPEVCWHVMEAVSRAALIVSAEDRTLGPVLLEVDDSGCILSEPLVNDGFLVNGHRIRTGESILPLFEPDDRGGFVRLLEQPRVGEAFFCPLRLGSSENSHTACVGARRLDPGRVAILVQPLIPGGPVVGRHINNRDPITGLLTRWAMSRMFEGRQATRAVGYKATVIVLKLPNLPSISEYIGGLATDDVLVRVASALTTTMPYPAVCSRPMGSTFVAFLPDTSTDGALDRASEVINAVHEIDVPGFASGFTLSASVGIASVARGDYDLALRRATSAVNAADAAGSDQAVVAGPAFTPAQISELSTKLELGDWEVWLQPVVSQGAEHASHLSFHEALARFTNGRGHLVSRPDLFVTGRVQGLLEKFDQMMVQRVMQILAAHPSARISVNLTLETFTSNAFPAAIIDLIREVPDCSKRIVLEIAPHCLMGPPTSVRPRLEALAAAGIPVALDDFGSGVCRLNALTQFPLAIVKLDEIVTGYVDDDPLQREFIRAVVSICRARGITTVAEYTRSQEQLKRLIEDGVDLFQGQLFGMPARATEVLGAPVGVAASS